MGCSRPRRELHSLAVAVSLMHMQTKSAPSATSPLTFVEMTAAIEATE